MPLRISNEELKHVRSGTALRFTVHVLIDDAGTVGIEVKGFMAFRNGSGEIDVKGPVVYLNLYGKRIKFYGTTLTPEASKSVREHIEAQWGDKLKSDPDWNGERAALQKRQKELGWEGL